MRKRWTRVVVLLLALLAGPGHILAAPPAQPAGLTMTVRAGYDGHYKLGDWFPVQVTLSNTGQPVDATVQVEAIGPNNDVRVATYARPVSLPAPARKQVTLYTFAASYQHSIRVQLLRQDTVLAEQNVAIEPLNNAFLLGVVSDSPDLLNGLSNSPLGSPGDAQPATVAHLPLADLPESAPALAGLDALVFANTDTSKLSPAARLAIAGWVVDGGTLVVGGGAAGPATTAGLADLLPVTLGSSRPVATLDPLGSYAGGAAPPAAGALVSEARLRPDLGATAVITLAGQPLLARRPLGAGEVLALGLDPAQPPLRTWDRGTAFWQAAFGDHPVRLSAAARRRTANFGQGGLNYGSPAYYSSELSPFDLPVLQLPSVPEVGGFLLLYVLVIGPLNYWLLRRRRRTELAWLTMPALIVLFVVAAYVLGYQSKGGQLRLTTGSVVRAYPGAPLATVASFVGLFSPNRATYDVQFAGDVQLSEVNSSGLGGGSPNGNPATFVQGPPSGIPGLNVDTWALRSFQAETAVAYPVPYAGQFQIAGGLVTGQLTNRGSLPLDDVAVIAGSAVQRLGTLAPGQSVAVQVRSASASGIESLLGALVPGVQLGGYPPPASAADREKRRRAALLATALDEGTPAGGGLSVRIAGWSTQVPFAVGVAGQSPLRDDLVLITSQFPVEQPSGQITLPAGLISRRLVAGNVQANNSPSGDLTITSDATFEYRLPTDMQITRLTLDYAQDKLRGGAGSNPDWPQIAVYNRRTNQWDPIQDAGGQAVGAEDSYSGDLPAPADYVGADGAVRLQVRTGPGAYSGPAFVKRLDLSVEGHRAP